MKRKLGCVGVYLGFRLLGFNCWRCNAVSLQSGTLEEGSAPVVRERVSCYSAYRGVAL